MDANLVIWDGDPFEFATRAEHVFIRGVERNRYWVYTSRDIQVAHFLQRRFETPYALLMRLANERFAAVMREAELDA